MKQWEPPPCNVATDHQLLWRGAWRWDRPAVQDTTVCKEAISKSCHDGRRSVCVDREIRLSWVSIGYIGQLCTKLQIPPWFLICAEFILTSGRLCYHWNPAESRARRWVGGCLEPRWPVGATRGDVGEAGGACAGGQAGHGGRPLGTRTPAGARGAGGSHSGRPRHAPTARWGRQPLGLEDPGPLCHQEVEPRVSWAAWCEGPWLCTWDSEPHRAPETTGGVGIEAGKRTRGSPGGPVVKDLPAGARDGASIPGPERRHVARSSRALRLCLGPWAAAAEPTGRTWRAAHGRHCRGKAAQRWRPRPSRNKQMSQFCSKLKIKKKKRGSEPDRMQGTKNLWQTVGTGASIGDQESMQTVGTGASILRF